ncbi:hypothetical protein CRUP_030975, partial [Coryphaenoides rupestris]
SASTTPSGSPCSSQQSVYPAGEAAATTAPADTTGPAPQPTWNPFGDDNFSKLTAEELLNKDFAKLGDAEPGEKTTGSSEDLLQGLQDFPAERAAAMRGLVDAGAAFVSVPDPFNALSLSDTPEKLIEGLRSPETSSLLLPDLLALADPFSACTQSSSAVKAEMCADPLIPGLEARQAQRHAAHMDLGSSGVPDPLVVEDSLLGCDLLSHNSTPALTCSSSSSCSSAPPPGSGSCLDDLASVALTPGPTAAAASSDSGFLMLAGEKTTEDEFDPIPVVLSKNPNQGGHSRSNSGSSESSIPNMARPILLVDQLIDL